MSAEVLVTGGTGVLGRQIAELLRSAGAGVRVMSRRGKPGTVRWDLLAGEGLERAVVVWIPSSTAPPARSARPGSGRGRDGTPAPRRREGGSIPLRLHIHRRHRPRILTVLPIELDTERVVADSPIPHTILRATQFYDLVLMVMRFLGRLPVIPLPFGFLGQPIDSGEVADLMVRLALSKPAGRVPDVGGPEVMTMEDAARTYLDVMGSRKRIAKSRFVARRPAPSAVAR